MLQLLQLLKNPAGVPSTKYLEPTYPLASVTSGIIDVNMIRRILFNSSIIIILFHDCEMRCAFDLELFNTDYLFDQIVYNSRAHKKKKVYRDHHLPSALLFLIFVHRTVHKGRLQLRGGKGSKFQRLSYEIGELGQGGCKKSDFFC